MTKRSASQYPSEDQEQVSIFQELDTLGFSRADVFSYPSGGKRSIKTAKNMKATGQGAGVSDIVVAIPTKHHPGAFGELKKNRACYPKKSKYRYPGARQSQLDFLHRKGTQGYAVWLAYGAFDWIVYFNVYMAGNLSTYDGQFDCEGEKG